MLPGSAETNGRYVQVTSAAMPRNFAPSSKLTFDPSLTRLIAAASVQSTSRYEEPGSWPDVFSPGNSPGASTAPGAGSGSVSPSEPAVPSLPVAPPVSPSGGFGSGGGSVWVPSPVILPPSTSAPSVVPEISTPIVVPAVPEAPVVISLPTAERPVAGRVPDGGSTFLMLALSSLFFAALRKRLPQS